MIKVTLPDGSVREFARGTTVAEVASAISARLGQECFGAVVGGEIADLRAPLVADSNVRIFTRKDPESLDVLRHSTAHVMATAVKRLWPDARVGIGPCIEDGYYYDFEFASPITEDDLPRIEEEMKRVIEEDSAFERCEIRKHDALARFESEHEPYKKELAEGFVDGEITIYKNNEFEDLCRGPHVRSTKDIKAFKVLKLAGAYWRGDSNRPQLTRIYGTSWHKESDLTAYLNRLEEAKKRDHRLLGKQLELFSFSPHSPGSVFLHPAGMVVWNELVEFMRALLEQRGYGEVRTPILLDRQLWVRSGHWEKYADKMFTLEGDEPIGGAVAGGGASAAPIAGAARRGSIGIKPMNCPGAILIYSSRHHSYRELPLRLAEFGQCHRNEQSGELHGLARVRSFVQDDAHIFCALDQIESEIQGLIDLVETVYKATFGLEYRVELSTRPEVFQGEIAAWDQAEAALESALASRKLDFKLNPGDGAFYGPKIDFHVRDCLGRSWQCGTIQLDFTQPENFDLTYAAADNSQQRPVMIHRAIYGSIERFYMVLVEHFAGAFPLWLAPEQARVVAISDSHHEYARNVRERLIAAGIRTGIDLDAESMGAKIRRAAQAKTPYILVAGDREIADGTVAVRMRGERKLGALPVEEVIARLMNEIRTRALD